MSLPRWTPEGVLPVGVHQASMSDVYDRMVLDAPDRARREVLYSALRAYLGLISRFVRHGRVWIDGGFTMQKEGPLDIDVAVLPADWQELSTLLPEDQVHLLGLLTVQDVIASCPEVMWLERVQPIGGALDAFLVRPGHESAWREAWSAVRRDGVLQEDQAKGFAEVSW